MLFCLQGADSPDHRHSQHSPLDGHRNSPSSSPQQLSDTEDVSAVSMNGHIWFPDSLFLALIQRYYLTCGLALTLAGLQLPEHDLRVPLNMLSAVKWLVSQLAREAVLILTVGSVQLQAMWRRTTLMWRWGRWCDVGVADVTLGSLMWCWGLWTSFESFGSKTCGSTHRKVWFGHVESLGKKFVEYSVVG